MIDAVRRQRHKNGEIPSTPRGNDETSEQAREREREREAYSDVVFFSRIQFLQSEDDSLSFGRNDKWSLRVRHRVCHMLVVLDSEIKIDTAV